MPTLDQILHDPFELIVPLALLAGTVLAGLVLRRLLFRILRQWSDASTGHVGVLITESLQGPIVLWSLMLGLHLATQHSEIPKKYLHDVPAALMALWIVSLTMAMSRLAGNVVRFYGGRVTGAQSVTTLTQKLAQLGVVIVGAAWLLKVVFDLSLAPILTTLGVGGIAVALALQNTLSNLFAGFYVSVSGLIYIGNYIKLNTGEEGYVTDITWRCTTMRSTSNNLIVVPNSKLGEAIYVNYHLPESRVQMSITFGVGYECDVDRVEAILLDETKSAVGEIPGLLGDPAPYVRFNPGPGDWSLNFQIFFNVAGYAEQSDVQSALRKRVFKRLQRDRISLPFPTRTVILEHATPAGDRTRQLTD